MDVPTDRPIQDWFDPIHLEVHLPSRSGEYSGPSPVHSQAHRASNYADSKAKTPISKVDLAYKIGVQTRAGKAITDMLKFQNLYPTEKSQQTKIVISSAKISVQTGRLLWDLIVLERKEGRPECG